MTASEVSSAWGEWVASLTDWHVFGGMTYSPERKWGMPGLDTVRYHTFNWLRSAPAAIGRPVDAAVVAIERHENGWPHLHPLLRLNGGVQAGDLAGLGQLWFKKHGYARLELPRNQADVSAYAAKYITKDALGSEIVLFRLKDFAVAAAARRSA